MLLVLLRCALAWPARRVRNKSQASLWCKAIIRCPSKGGAVISTLFYASEIEKEALRPLPRFLPAELAGLFIDRDARAVPCFRQQVKF